MSMFQIFNVSGSAVSAQSQRLIASNIANADTPGYVARDFDFATALRQATGQSSIGESSVAAPKLTLHTANPGHLNINGQPAGSRDQPDMNYATASQTNLDSNSVDMDRERANFADNTLRYEATLRFINAQVRTLNTAITGQ